MHKKNIVLSLGVARHRSTKERSCVRYGFKQEEAGAIVYFSSVLKRSSFQDVASTSVPPVLKPRYDNALLYIAVWAVVKHSVGILFTAFVFIVLLISAPFVLIFRYLHFARYRTQPISAPFIRFFCKLNLFISSNRADISGNKVGLLVMLSKYNLILVL